MVGIPPMYGDLGDDLLLFYPHYMVNKYMNILLIYGIHGTLWVINTWICDSWVYRLIMDE